MQAHGDCSVPALLHVTLESVLDESKIVVSEKKTPDVLVNEESAVQHKIHIWKIPLCPLLSTATDL